MEILRKGDSEPTKETYCDNCNAWFKYTKSDVHTILCSNGDDTHYIICPCCHHSKDVSYAVNGTWFK